MDDVKCSACNDTGWVVNHADFNSEIPCDNCNRCGCCGGSGFVPRDPDIGTDQECSCCNGTGIFDDTPKLTQ
ncbi:hypothetical protein JXVLWARM_CDS_0097 [Burkholderia phage Bm1]